MKKIILAVLLLIGVTGAMAQEVYNSSGKTNYKKKKKTGYDPDKLVVGGGINLGLGTGFASFGVAPMVGYRIQKPLIVGIGLGYQYQKSDPSLVDLQNKLHYSYFNVIYPNVWARCFVYRNLYATAGYEYDIINVKAPVLINGNLERITANVSNQCALVGVGSKQPISGRVSLYLELIYDVLQGKYSPYPKGFPGIRFGLAAGL